MQYKRCAEEFRRIARNALRGKWTMAVLVGVVASLLGGTGSDGLQINLDVDRFGARANVEFAGQTIFSIGDRLTPEVGALLAGTALYITLLAIVMAVVYFLLSSIVSVGYARSNLNLVDGGEASFQALFDYFPHWKNAALTKLRKALFVFGGYLLFVIPGILAMYSYAMTEFILAEDPELSASEAMARSKELMDGNRWRLFCLQLSFFGWMLLASLTLGIGNLWLTPYRQAATAAFYRELTDGPAAYDPAF